MLESLGKFTHLDTKSLAKSLKFGTDIVTGEFGAGFHLVWLVMDALMGILCPIYPRAIQSWSEELLSSGAKCVLYTRNLPS